MVEISEAAFEAAIERALLAGGPDAPPDEIRKPPSSTVGELPPGKGGASPTFQAAALAASIFST